MKILTVIGARPQFIKAAALSRAIQKHNKTNSHTFIEDIILHTGQHYDVNMSDIFFEDLAIPKPAYHLNIGSGTHGQQTGQMLIRIEEILMEEQPDYLLVYGDTNSTLSGALAASKLHIPIVHVEAGLRSYNRRMPEELNRVLTDHISHLLFCPTEEAVHNLNAEGIHRNIHCVGDVMFDCFLAFAQIAEHKSKILQTLPTPFSNANPFNLATVHRAENTDSVQRLTHIFEALNETGLPVIMPLHPRTKKALLTHKIKPGSHIYIVDPLSYLDMCFLLKRATLVLTDSGGLQKEAFFAQVPCITLRDETEWRETVTSGWNRVTGTEKKSISSAVNAFQSSPPLPTSNSYGNGNAAEKIVATLIHYNKN